MRWTMILAAVLAFGGSAAGVAQIGGEEPGGAAASRPIGPVRISSGVMASLLIKRVEPVYPANVDASGTVVLRVLVGKDGQVTEVTVITGPTILRAATMDAVRQWVYKPYLLNGEPTAVHTIVVLNGNRNGSGR
jgi:protein TonB